MSDSNSHQRCETCHYFAKFKINVDGDGLCVRHAPVISPSKYGWSLMSKTEWCGDYEWREKFLENPGEL